MNNKGNQYAIFALKDRRATLAGEIVQFKEGIRNREDQLSHLDATLRVLDPSYRADTIAPMSRPIPFFASYCSDVAAAGLSVLTSAKARA